MTVAAYYAGHQVEGRAFIEGRPGCWFTRDKCAVVSADTAYRYCTASGYTVALQAGACVDGYLDASLVAGRRGMDSIHIVKGQRWQRPKPTRRIPGRKSNALTPAQARSIRAQIQHGARPRDLVKEHGLSVAVVSRIARGVHPALRRSA